MQRKTGFLLTAVAVLLSSAAIARADTTYTIAATPGDPGSISGSITGTGTTVTSFDITVSGVTVGGGLETFTFDSADGSFGNLYSEGDFTASGTPVNDFFIQDPDADILDLSVTGDFTSGFVVLSAQNIYDSNGEIIGQLSGSVSLLDSGDVNDDVGGFSLTPDVAPTPEPSSWLLLATGLAGLSMMAMKRRQFS